MRNGSYRDQINEKPVIITNQTHSPGNLSSLTGTPEEWRRSWRRLVCVVLPDLSRPSITMNAPRFGIGLGYYLGLMEFGLNGINFVCLASTCGINTRFRTVLEACEVWATFLGQCQQQAD